jgi:hypothetical protein
MKRPLQKSDIAEHGHQAGRSGVAFEAAAMFGQYDEGKVGPGRLRGYPRQKTACVGAARGFFRDDRGVGPAPDLLQEIRNVDANAGVQPGIAQDFLGHERIAAARSQN